MKSSFVFNEEKKKIKTVTQTHSGKVLVFGGLPSICK